MRIHQAPLAAQLAAGLFFAAVPATAADWTDFRGGGSFVSEAVESPPAEWSIEDGTNVAWSVGLPGRGVSGPIVVGDRVVVTCSGGPDRQRLYVAAYDAADGSRLWRRQMWATGRTFCHPTSSVAAPTPATDGERVFVFYSSSDLAAFDLDGRLLWFRPLALDHPGVGNDVGMASSPVVAGDVVVVQAECQRTSFVIACDRQTGETRWEAPRPKASNWASPLAIETAAGPAVVLQSSERIVAHDAATGAERWAVAAECGSMSSVSRIGDTLVAPGGGLTAIRFGDGAAAEVWRADRLKAASTCPVPWRDKVLVINRAGVLNCGDLATGAIVWRRRLGGSFWATPVVAGGRAYCVNARGKAFVVDLEDEGAILAEPAFGEDVLATPAVGDGALFVRAYARLWKIAAPRIAGAASERR